MGHCPGCGADIWEKRDTYGHILGCGVHLADPSSIEDHRCPWSKALQRRILAEALAETFADAKAAKKADDLGWALQGRLTYVAGLDATEREDYAREGSSWESGDKEDLLRELDRLTVRLQQLRDRL